MTVPLPPLPPLASASVGVTEKIDATSSAAIPPPSRSRSIPIVMAVVGLVLFAMPFVDATIPGVFTGPMSSPGTLQILAIGLVFASVAMSYDLLLGYTGLLSLGHAFYFALGLYGTNYLMRAFELSYVAAVPIALVVTLVAALLFGSVSLRVRGVAFAMVTLAFAEAFHVFVEADPMRITGGEEGLALASGQVPSLLTGVVNTRWVYWLALALAAFTFAVCRQAVSSRAGRVWQAIRENEDRVELLGLIPFRFKLLSFALSAVLAACGGAVYLLLVRGATPFAASSVFTLNLIVMVVLGGVGRLWGAALGGMVFGYLQLRLPGLARSGVFDPLPDWLEGPLTEPLFILGVLFIVLVMFAPGGLASIPERVGLRRRDPAGGER
jgi:branched-chain amino acid transport system permease protein